MNSFCKSCGEPINPDAEICPKCGVRQRTIATKNPGTAAVLSFLYSGLGQIYNGELGKGLALIVLQCINVALFFVIIGLFLFPLVWVYGVWDAYITAERLNSQG